MSLFRAHTTHHHHDGKRCPASTPGATAERRASKKWYGYVNGKKTPLCANKAAALQMLARLRGEAEAGVEGAHRRMRALPLADHLAAFAAEVRAGRGGKGGNAPGGQHVAKVTATVRRLIERRSLRQPDDLTLAATRQHLAELLSEPEPVELPDREWYTPREVRAILGRSPQRGARLAARHGLPVCGVGSGRRYPREAVAAMLALRRGGRAMTAGTVALAANTLRRFGGWLARRCGWPVNPLADLERSSTLGDHRHGRRALTAAELGRLLAATRSSARVRRGLSGRDRWAIYLTALATGFRRREVASLTPSLFRLDRSPPVVLLPSRTDKAGRSVEQPLPPRAAEALSEYLAGRPPASLVWPGGWWRDAADLLRRDLADAGIPYVEAGPDGPLFADFHALRHTFIALLDRAGVTLKQAMQLARHSDPKLTLRVYGKARLAELGDAVSRLDGADCLPACLPTGSTTSDDQRATASAKTTEPAARNRKNRKG